MLEMFHVGHGLILLSSYNNHIEFLQETVQSVGIQ